MAWQDAKHTFAAGRNDHIGLAAVDIAILRDDFYMQGQSGCHRLCSFKEALAIKIASKGCGHKARLRGLSLGKRSS
jgi:hypothetical protein